MKPPTFAIVTPSYTPDYQRCALLARSVKELVAPDIRHYIVVERRELPLFSGLRGPRTEILTVESLLPWWLLRLPLARRWWLSLKSKPVRNWIMQQIVKLAMPQHLDDDVLLYVDSDNAFIRPFSGEMFLRGAQVRLYRAAGEANLPSQAAWHRTAAQLLGLPSCDYFGARYIGNIPTWRRDTVLRLHEHIETTTGRHWMQAVAGHWHFSEFILYGVFCDRVLGDASGHYNDAAEVCLEYWNNCPLSENDLRNFILQVQPAHVAAMISARAEMGVAWYEEIVKRCVGQVSAAL